MIGTKVHALLSIFDSDDWKHFHKYVIYRAEHRQDTVKLSEYIQKHSAHLNSQRFSFDACHQVVGRDKSRKAILNLYSELTGLIKDYLAERKLRDDSRLSKVILVKSLQGKGANDLANSLHKKLSVQFEKETYSWWSSFYQHLLDHYVLVSDNPRSKDDKSHQILQSTIDHLTTYYLELRSLYTFIGQHQLSIGLRNYKQVNDDYPSKRSSTPSLLESTLNQLTSLRTTGDEQIANDLYNLFKESHASLSSELRLILYTALKMFFTEKVNHGALEHIDDPLFLHKTMIAHDYIQFNDQVGAMRLINIISLASFNGQTKWAESMFQKNLKRTPVSMRMDFKNISKGLIAIGRKEYSTAIQILSQYYPTQILFKSIFYRLSIIAHLEDEPENNEIVKSKIKNLRIYLHRNKSRMSVRSYQGSLNFAKIMTMINDQKSNKAVEEKMQELQPLFYRLYLSKKLKIYTVKKI